jgi:hypothetical protein
MRPYLLILIAFFVGCSSAPPAPAPESGAPTLPAHFTATFHHETGELTFARVEDSDLRPASVDPINDPSGANGHPTAADVDLTSPNPCTFPPGQFQCGVEMIWGSTTRSLPNPVVQIDKATIAGVSTTKYDANNSDGNNPLAVSIDHGLWVYTNSGEPDMANPVASGGPYYLTPGFNTGTRLWSFDNPGNADVIYDILVWTSLHYSTYQLASAASSVTYVNACAGGASATASVTSIPLPFDVTVYDQTTAVPATVNMGLNGELTFGSVPLDFPGPPPTGGLPSTSAAEPGVWPFWDDLVLKPTGLLCYELTGVAPNRSVVLEWQGMDFAEAPDVGSALDFEAIVHEGTSRIDFVYHSMVGAPGDTSGRQNGSQAFVGVQNATGTAAVGRYSNPLFRTGVKVTLVPKP